MRLCRPINLTLAGYAYKDRRHFTDFFESNVLNQESGGQIPQPAHCTTTHAPPPYAETFSITFKNSNRNMSLLIASIHYNISK